MDSQAERLDPELNQALRGLVTVCERIAVSLDRLEQHYSGEIQVHQQQRHQAELAVKASQEKWEQDAPLRTKQDKEWEEQRRLRDEADKCSAEASKLYLEASKTFYHTVKFPGWLSYFLWFVVAMMLAGLLKASVRYLFGYWSIG